MVIVILDHTNKCSSKQGNIFSVLVAPPSKATYSHAWSPHQARERMVIVILDHPTKCPTKQGNIQLYLITPPNTHPARQHIVILDHSTKPGNIMSELMLMPLLKYTGIRILALVFSTYFQYWSPRQAEQHILVPQKARAQTNWCIPRYQWKTVRFSYIVFSGPGLQSSLPQ